MCSVVACLVPRGASEADRRHIDRILGSIIRSAAQRGRDSHGITTFRLRGVESVGRVLGSSADFDRPLITRATTAVLVNCRAEPTTEFVSKKQANDIQPFDAGHYWVSHNGTIANDRALHERLGGMPADGTRIDSAVIPRLCQSADIQSAADLRDMLLDVVGSYALAIVDARRPDRLMLATNYKPLYIARHTATGAIFVASLDDFFPWTPGYRLMQGAIEPLAPYSAAEITSDGIVARCALRQPRNHRALVVASGGLDSTVVAAKMADDGFDVNLLHFRYGCRASKAEERAIQAISDARGWPALAVDVNHLFRNIIGGSPLTGTGEVNRDGAGEAGAEFAFEWVPARNLIMLSIAAGIAEAHGFDVIALGANLEEAGAYPDNEQEFIRRFDAALPYAIGPTRRVEVVMPVGHLVKHEIVRLGLTLGAPLDLTWSCYENGERHCGRCGPCFMRRVAFKMCGKVDPVFGEAVCEST